MNLAPVDAIQMVLFWITCAGMVAACRWELVGGAISPCAIFALFAVELSVTGELPKGLVFHLMLVPGVLFIISSLMKRRMPAV